MAFEEEKTYNTLLAKVRKACKVAYCVLRAFFIFACALWVVLIATSIITLLLPDVVDWSAIINAPAFIQIILLGFLSILIIYQGMLVFRDIYKGESPFSEKQSRRIRIMAFVIFAQVILETVSSAVVPALFATDHLSVSYETTSSTEPTLYVNLQGIVFAVIFFCLSFAFQYGSLLQQDKDDFV